MKILITGMAGMIGFHCALKLHRSGHEVVGMDNFNPYYDPQLKEDRADILAQSTGVVVEHGDLVNYDWDKNLEGVDAVLHLAAYANPRHSLEFPQHYIDTNITGTQRLIEATQRAGTPKVVYASSSCVMHGQPLPWNEHDRPGHQNNPYGWSKRANECQFMHSTLDNTIGLRFFTVYGPYGRPDMALFKFADGIVKDEPITLYNYGDMKRDFTYVEDIVQGVQIVLESDIPGHEIFNIGYGEQVQLLDFVDCIEKEFGRKAMRNLEPKHPADVPETWSDTTKLKKYGYNPTTPIADGVHEFCNWYKSYYGVN